MWGNAIRLSALAAAGAIFGGWFGLAAGIAVALLLSNKRASDSRLRLERHAELLDEARKVLQELDLRNAPTEARVPLNLRLHDWKTTIPETPTSDPNAIHQLQNEIAEVRALASGCFSSSVQEKLRMQFVKQLWEDLQSLRAKATVLLTPDDVVRRHRQSEAWSLVPKGATLTEIDDLVAHAEKQLQAKWSNCLSKAQRISALGSLEECDGRYIEEIEKNLCQVDQLLADSRILELELPSPWKPELVQIHIRRILNQLQPLWEPRTRDLSDALAGAATKSALEDHYLAARSLHFIFEKHGIKPSSNLTFRDQKRVWIKAHSYTEKAMLRRCPTNQAHWLRNYVCTYLYSA